MQPPQYVGDRCRYNLAPSVQKFHNYVSLCSNLNAPHIQAMQQPNISLDILFIFHISVVTHLHFVSSDYCVNYADVTR